MKPSRLTRPVVTSRREPPGPLITRSTDGDEPTHEDSQHISVYLYIVQHTTIKGNICEIVNVTPNQKNER